MAPLPIVVIDTMTFVYLQALGWLDIVDRMTARTGKLAVTRSVVQQLHRSPRLGPVVQGYCDRGALMLLSPRADDDVSGVVCGVVGTPVSRLVRRNRADSELVEVAALRDGAILSSERGIRALAERRRVPSVDLLAFLAWAVRVGVLSAADAEACTAPWTTAAADATGAPSDLRGSFDETARRRKKRLSDLVDSLVS